MRYDCRCNPCRCAEHAHDPRRREPGHTPAGPCAGGGEVAEPSVGAHLVTPRRGYTHRGIYAGNGRVIHYAGLSRKLSRGPVEEVPLEQFAAQRSISIHCREPLPFGRDEIVRRARTRLGEDRYRVLTNNCEHFTEWAQFGLSRSMQVERWIRPATVTVQLAADAGRLFRSLLSVSTRWLSRRPAPADPSRIA